MKRIFLGLAIIGLLSSGVAGLEASYTCNVFVKYPFPIVSQFDTLTVVDTFSVGTKVKVDIYRSGNGEMLSLETVTSDSGAVVTFENWGDNIPVEGSNIDRMDIELPNANKVQRIGKQIVMDPVIFKNVIFQKKSGEDIIATLPKGTVQNNPVDIGPEDMPVIFKFAILTDLHIGTGGDDFEGGGYTPAWQGTNGSGDIEDNINNVIAVRDYLIQKIQDEDIKFVVALGDITDKAQRAEFEHARRRILEPLGVPFIPVFGNHDTWAYKGGFGNYDQEPEGALKIGGYFLNYGFGDYYDSLSSVLPIPNWKESYYLSHTTETEGHDSYFFNLSFDYQNCHFLIGDFVSRVKAATGWPGTMPDADIYSPWQWFWNDFDQARSEYREIVVLNHHPLIPTCTWRHEIDFDADEIHRIDDSLDTRDPTLYFKYWFAGHDHKNKITTTYCSGDIVAHVYRTAQAFAGWCRIVSVHGSAKADITFTPSPPLSTGQRVDFYAQLSKSGSDPKIRIYEWDFGDGTSDTTVLNPVPHWYSNKGVYKVTLTVIPEVVSIAKMIEIFEPPQVTVVYPNGGECFKNLEHVHITWEVLDEYTITSQTVYYSINSGSSWKKIADLDGSSRSYWWTIPRSQSSSSNCRAKVVARDNQSNSYYDISDDDFEIWQFEPYLSGMLRANGEVLADLHWSWDPGPYYLDHYELWRNKVVIYTGTGTSYTDPLPFNPGDSRQYRVDVFYRRTPGGSLFGKSSNVITLARPGGCPYVFSWDGTEFSEDNNILAGSGDGENALDFYKLRQSLIEENGEYRLELREFENEHSFINMLKLIAIDHPGDIDIEVLEDDIILPYRDAIAPLYCVDQNGEDWTELVATPDEGYFEGYEDDTLTMNFGEIGAGSYVFLPMAAPKSGSIDVATYDLKTGWQIIQSIYPREYSSVSPVVINHLLNDSLKIQLIWHSYHRLEYAGLGKIRNADYHIKLCPLVSAAHSNIGSVKQKLLIDDEDYAELLPDDSITLEFATVDIKPGWVRNFVFVSNGYYITETCGGGAQTAYSNIPLVHFLSLYPNPARNDMTIRFGIPREEKVSLKVYDVSGREVKTLVDDRLEAGYHTIRLDGKNLPSGIYFARLVTDGYEATKKLVLMK